MDLRAIEIKDFEKLKQSDRIELLLKLNRIEKKEEDSYFKWYELTNPCCVGILFILLISFVMYGAGIIQGLLLLRFVPFLVAIIILIALIGTFYNVLTEITNKKIRYELKKEYFTTEVKKNK